MTFERAIITLLLVVVAGFLAGGSTIEVFSSGLILGSICGTLVGAAYMVDGRRAISHD